MSREMSVAELREMLEQYGENVKVRIVHQPNWPLAEVVGGIYDPSSNRQECMECGYGAEWPIHQSRHEDFDHEFEGDGAVEENGVIYLVANGHPSEGSPYGSKAAWEQMERAY